jgi:hypothetical protein
LIWIAGETGESGIVEGRSGLIAAFGSVYG